MQGRARLDGEKFCVFCGYNLTDPSRNAPEGEQPSREVLLEVARRVQAVRSKPWTAPPGSAFWCAEPLNGVDLPRRYTEEDMNAERIRVQEETEAEVLARDGVYTQEEQDAAVAAAREEERVKLQQAPAEPVETEALVSGEVEPEPVEVWVEPGLMSKWAVHVRAGQHGWQLRIARKWPEHTAKLVVSMLQHLGVAATLREEGE